MVALLQPGLTRASLHDDRLGHLLDALFAAHLNQVLSAVALTALEVYAIPTPWLHQDTTTIALYGAYEDDPAPPGTPRPAYGHSEDGRNELKQVLFSLGGSGDSGVPMRVGLRDGNRHASVETPQALEECLALGWEGVRGLGADSQAYSRRTLGVRLEHKIDLVTLVPRTCAVRQELEAWGRQQPALPLLVEKPGRTQDEAPRHWHGPSVLRIIQRQVRLYLRTHAQQLPGNKGATATPTAAVVLPLFAQVALVQLLIGDQEVEQVYSIQPHHLLLCDALGLDYSWDRVPSAQKNGRCIQTP